MRSFLKKLKLFMVVGFAVAFTFDLSILVCLHFPKITALIPGSCREFVRKIYYRERHNPITTDGHFTYDKELTYTLSVGSYQLKNTEYQTSYSVNSAHVRDSEASLLSPEVIALGDSFTMGFGVDQEETFSHLIQQYSGLQVLNAGMTSYGTVRELKLVQRFDLSKLKVLVLQYCSNDYEENRYFMNDPRKYAPLPEKDFFQFLSEHRKEAFYYPLKYFREWMHIAINSGKKAGKLLQVDEDEEARALTFAIANIAPKLVKSTPIVIFELNPRGEQRPEFLNKVRKVLSSAPFRDRISFAHVQTLDGFSSEDFYTLDDHLTKAGHEKVARQINLAVSQLLFSRSHSSPSSRYLKQKMP